MAITRFGDFGNFVLKIWVSGISWKMWSSDCYSPLLSIVLQYLLPLDSSLQTSFSTLLQPAQCRPLKALSLQSFFRWYTTLVMLTSVLCVLSRSSRVCLFVTSWTAAHQTPLSMGFSRQEYWNGCHAFLQGNLTTQGLNPDLAHCMQVLYHMTHQGNPKFQLMSDTVHIYRIFFFLC